MGKKLAFGLLAVLAVARAQGLTASASPTSLAFSYVVGAPQPAALTMSVRASSGNPTYVTAIAPGSALWLTVTPDAGKLPGSLSVRVNPTSLAVGTYPATITIAVAGVTVPITVPVTLTITAPLPSLTVAPTAISFVSPPSPAAQTVTLSTTGTPVSFNASVSGATWLTVSPNTGVVLPGQQLTVTLSADPTGLAPQAKSYSGKVVIVANGVLAANKTQNITVTLTVNPPTPTINTTNGLWPSAVQANTGAATITVYGSGFYTATTVKVGGVSITPLIISATTLQVLVPAAQLSGAGTLNVVVSNPAPGGDSAPAVLTVSNAPVVQAVTSSASYAMGIVSPGEIVSLWGLGIGPSQPVTMTSSVNSGYADTTIGGLTISIDGNPCPILYADPNQITVQVPYEATIGSGKDVTVTNGTATPSSTTVTIQATAPGIFSADASGAGTAAAVVYNGTTGAAALNSQSSPAHAGDIVAVYVTGEGDYITTPAAHTGYIMPANTVVTDLPQLAVMPTVTIGAIPASVKYAGPLPGSIVGLLQINILVPTGVTPGNTVPINITVGAASIQTGVTLVVK